MRSFFDMYFNALNGNCFFEDEDSAQCIFNADKTGCLTDPNKLRVFLKKSSNDSYILTFICGKAIYTALVCGSASGDYLPPLAVYKRFHLYSTWCQNRLDNAGYSNSLRGQMSDSIFQNWLS